ncbi:Bug family tripartite tricarboxylate transporter substrate binding protein [Bordetella sp. 2513F-2]
MDRMKGRIAACISLALITGAAAIAGPAAAAWPDRPLTLVVPYSPGGSTDTTARLVAEQMSVILKQSVVVENRPGAGGNLAATHVSRAEADGNTMLMTSTAHLSNRALYKSLPYDIVKDFAPVSQISLLPAVLVVSEKSPIQDLASFVERAKGASTPLTYGSAGVGTIQHLAGSLFASKAGLEMTHVPYKGGSPALTDLIGGQIDAVFAPEVEVLGHIREKRLRALAVSTPQRSAALPGVPAANEVVRGFDISFWNGLLVPAATPADRVKTLSDAVIQALKTPKVKDALEAQGSTPTGNTPEQFKELIGTEIPRWAEIVRISGAEPQ